LLTPARHVGGAVAGALVGRGDWPAVVWLVLAAGWLVMPANAKAAAIARTAVQTGCRRGHAPVLDGGPDGRDGG
jgi:hypothetical protein